jgi:hypothetical protein
MPYDIAKVVGVPIIIEDDDGAADPMAGGATAPESPTVKALLVANILPLYFEI